MKKKYLTGILSSLQEPGTHHALGDLAGVGVAAFLRRQDGELQTLQEERVEH